jgi:hypothetical protein
MIRTTAATREETMMWRTKQEQIEECSQAMAEEHTKRYPDYDRLEAYKRRKVALMLSDQAGQWSVDRL